MEMAQAEKLHLLHLRQELRDLRDARFRWGRLVGDWLRVRAGQNDPDLRVRMQRDAQLVRTYMGGHGFCSDHDEHTGMPFPHPDMAEPVWAVLERTEPTLTEEGMVAVAGMFDAEETRLQQRVRDREEPLAGRGRSGFRAA